MTSFVCFSQKGTDTLHTKKDSSICFPVSVARLIAKDLLRGDSCSAILESTKQELSQVYNKVDLKDSIIDAMTEKDSLYQKDIEDQKAKYSILDSEKKKLEFKLAESNITKGIYKYGFWGSLGILLFTLILHK